MLAKLILILADAAKSLGLDNIDLNNVKELLDHNEYGIAFDTIVTQLYEYEIEIDVEFYNSIEGIAKRINISEDEYSFMKELIRTENKIPKPVKENLAEILRNLQSN